MSYRQTLSNSSSQCGFSPGLQPFPAWLAILGLVFVSTVSFFAGASSILRFVFPSGAFAVGVLLYYRYSRLYTGFTLWLWILTPLVARLVDYRSGWDPQRLILITPFLVTLATLSTFLRYLPVSYHLGGLPFILSFVGVFYGFLVGLIKNTPLVAIRSLLDWLTPIVFSFYLFMNWRDYPRYRQNLQRVFLWGVLVTGIYAVVQYLVAPEWDRLWLIESGMTTSAGRPEPLGMRVWSTMNSPGPFANFMMAGLVLLFSNPQALRVPAAAVGYLAFLLTLVRSAWVGWLIALFTFTSSLKARLQIRLIISILIISICALPLTRIEPFSNVIGSRLQTFSNLEQDTSFRERASNYDRNLSIALSQGLGNGLGGVWVVNKYTGALEPIVIDSGILDMFFTLGWLGAIPYLGGLVLILYSVIQYSEGCFDPFMSAVRALGISCFVQLIFGSAMLGFSGLLLWGFLGLAMAAHKYHQHQRSEHS